MRWRAPAFAAVFVSVVATVFTVVGEQPAHALSGAEFQAGNIVSDSVFYDSSALNENGVQSFLNAQYQGCASGHVCLRDYTAKTTSHAAESGLCGAYTGKASETSAAIIANVSRACGINPQMMLVLLQKESGLVTATSPTADTYRTATGNGCPDTSGCDSKYYGFFNQVYGAARSFKYYRLHPSQFNYVAGRSNYILYNPNTRCGGSNVYIENQATAGLYDYTPYQPNAAALANLHGTGDSCSAYGNRNFWVFYNTWFSAPSAPYDSGGLVATKPDGTLWYYRNTGSATRPYTSGVQIGLSGWQHLTHVVSGDVDGDGLADLVATRSDGTLWLYRNNGTSLPYSNRVKIGASGWGAFNRFTAGDVDGDGLADLVATKADGTLWLYRNTGNPAKPFSGPVRIGASGWQSFDRIILGDVDGDGRADLIAIRSDGSLWVYGSVGGSSHPFVTRAEIGASGWSAFSNIVAGDVNSDGLADLVATRPGGTMWLYANAATGSQPFAHPVKIGASGWQAFDRLASTAVPVPRRTEPADLVARRPDGTLWGYPDNPAPRPYAARVVIGASGWQNFTHVAAGDVDGDGRADLVATRSNGTLWLYRATGSGSRPYAAGVRIGASGWQNFTHIAAGDVDGDGRADLVATKPDGSLWLYRTTGNASRPYAAGVVIGASGWQAFDRVVLADVNGDGRADLMATKPDGSLWTYTNTRSATRPFSTRAQTTLTGWQGFQTVVAGDVDGDGHADLVATRADGSLWLDRDGGIGRFPGGTEIGASGWRSFAVIMVADVDGDGLADLVATKPDGSLWLYRNSAQAAHPYLTSAQTGASGWQNFSHIVSADVDGDGHADLVATKPDGTLWLYINTGSSARKYAAGVEIGESGWQAFDKIAAGDVNGDGRADLVLTRPDGTLWLYPNTGSATKPFSPRVQIGASGWQGFDRLAVGDVNGDGLADLIATKPDGTLWTYPNVHNPDRPYRTRIQLGPSGWQAYDELVTGDVDHDGRTDLVARKPDGTLWMFRNDNSSTAPFGSKIKIGYSGWQSFDLLTL